MELELTGHGDLAAGEPEHHRTSCMSSPAISSKQLLHATRNSRGEERAASCSDHLWSFNTLVFGTSTTISTVASLSAMKLNTEYNRTPAAPARSSGETPHSSGEIPRSSTSSPFDDDATLPRLSVPSRLLRPVHSSTPNNAIASLSAATHLYSPPPPTSSRWAVSSTEPSYMTTAAIHAATAARLYPHAICLMKSIIEAIQKPNPGPAIFDALHHFTGPNYTPGVYNILIIALCKAGLASDASWVSYTLPHLPAAPACNALLHALLKLGRHDSVWKMYDEML